MPPNRDTTARERSLLKIQEINQATSVLSIKSWQREVKVKSRYLHNFKQIGFNKNINADIGEKGTKFGIF